MESGILDLAQIAIRRIVKAGKAERYRRALLALQKEIAAALGAVAAPAGRKP